MKSKIFVSFRYVVSICLCSSGVGFLKDINQTKDGTSFFLVYVGRVCACLSLNRVRAIFPLLSDPRYK